MQLLRKADTFWNILRRFGPVQSAWFAIAIGVLGLLGFTFKQRHLLSLANDWPSMSLATILGLMAFSATIFIHHYFTKRFVVICIGPLVSIGLSLLSWLVLALNLPLATWLNLTSSSPLPLISSPFTAFSIIALSMCFILQTFWPSLRTVVVSQLLAICVLALCFASLAGYLLDIPNFYMGQNGLGMALLTTSALLALAVGMFNYHHNQGWASLFYQPSLGGWLLRAALPILGVGLLSMLALGAWGQNLQLIEELPFVFSVILIGTLFWLARVAYLVNQTQLERNRLEHQFEALFEGNPDAILVVDTQGRIIRANQTLERLSGYSRQALLGQAIEMLMPAHLRNTHTTLRQQYQREPQPRSMQSGFEISMLCQDGSLCPVDVSLSPMQTESGQWIIAAIRDLTQHKQLVEKIERLSDIAVHDPLTGLANRMLVESFLHQACSSAARQQNLVAVCYFDLDGFKQVNDRAGHLTGDKLLIEVAHRLKSGVRSADMVARLGGDEFVVVLTLIEQPENAIALVEKLIESLGRSYCIAEQEWLLSASAGIAFYPRDGLMQQELLHCADTRMLRAKAQGKNCFLWQ